MVSEVHGIADRFSNFTELIQSLVCCSQPPLFPYHISYPSVSLISRHTKHQKKTPLHYEPWPVSAHQSPSLRSASKSRQLSQTRFLTFTNRRKLLEPPFALLPTISTCLTKDRNRRGSSQRGFSQYCRRKSYHGCYHQCSGRGWIHQRATGRGSLEHQRQDHRGVRCRCCQGRHETSTGTDYGCDGAS